MPPACYVANARMYAVNPATTRLWEQVFALAERISGVALRSVAHPWPADIEDLWERVDLGLVLLCGKAFRKAGGRHKPIAVPLPCGRPRSCADSGSGDSGSGDSGSGGASLYCTRFLVRADSPWQSLPDSFGSRLGWTVPHSHSGYNAVRYALLPYAADGIPYTETVGPLHTPPRCLEALLAHKADIVPLDSYWYSLLLRHAPERLAQTRVLADSPPAPMPFFAASPETPDHVCERLRNALCGLDADTLPPGLALDGFAPVNADDYLVLDAWEAAADAAGIHLVEIAPENICTPAPGTHQPNTKRNCHE